MPERLTKKNKEERLTFTREFDIKMYTRLQELEDMIEVGILIKSNADERVPYSKIQSLYNEICTKEPLINPAHGFRAEKIPD